MARPGELAELIADVFGLEPASVRQQARVLRDAGRMSKEKGGRGVGSMSPRDATNLVLAAGGTGRVKYSTLPLIQHGACKSEEGRWELDFKNLPELARLGSHHTLADTLEALIRSAMTGAVDPKTGKLIPPENANGVGGELAVQVTMYEPTTWSEVEIGLYSTGSDGERIISSSKTIRYRPRPGTDGQLLDPPFIIPPPGDLRHRHEFSEQVLWRIATLLTS